jgi:hypothetical protein
MDLEKAEVNSRRIVSFGITFGDNTFNGKGQILCFLFDGVFGFGVYKRGEELRKTHLTLESGMAAF